MPKSAPPSLYIGSPMHPHARKRRRTPPLRPSTEDFSPRRAEGASPSARGREKSSGLCRKVYRFRPKTANFVCNVHHFCTDRTAFCPRKAHSGAKKRDIAPSPLPKIGESRTPRKANLKRKLLQEIKFYSFHGRDCSFSRHQREIKAEKRAHVQKFVYLWS